MANIVTVTDPRGIKIVLSDDTWNKHILKRHPELKDKINDVIDTLENPTYICLDPLEINNHIYYSFLIARNSGKWYLKVLAEVQNNYGRVLSAFYVANGKSGEKMIWPGSET
jgi:hypothetical protein